LARGSAVHFYADLYCHKHGDLYAFEVANFHGNSQCYDDIYPNFDLSPDVHTDRHSYGNADFYAYANSHAY